MNHEPMDPDFDPDVDQNEPFDPDMESEFNPDVDVDLDHIIGELEEEISVWKKRVTLKQLKL